MKVLTIATDLDNAFLNRLLIPSCHSVGLDLVILHSTKPDFRLGDKRLILTNYLTTQAATDDLIMFTDAYDTLFIRGEQYIREAYADFSHSVVFSAEPNSWPLGPVLFALQAGPPVHPYPYLNSGGFIGPASDILKLCEKYPEPPNDQFELLGKLRTHGFDTNERFAFSDQYYWTLVHLLEPDLVGLDNKATIFENLSPQVGDVWDRRVAFGQFNFQAKGKAAASYQRERARLQERLRSPSAAAHVHFAGAMTKTALLDLLDEGALPSWLGDFSGAAHSGRTAAQVHRVTD